MVVNSKEGKVNDFDLEDDDDNDDSSSGGGKKPDDLKKMVSRLVLIILGVIVIVLLIVGISSIFGNKKYNYGQIENVMVNATKAYLAENPSFLEMVDTRTVEVPVANLVASGHMKDLSEYVKSGVSCTGKVVVSKVGSEYFYTPNLDCGEYYSVTSLASKVVEDSPITTSGYGLYSMNGEKVFRGELVNNYVKLDKALWRIVKIDSSNNTLLIKESYASYGSSWDNRFNESIGYNAGINVYSNSRVKEFLASLYDTSKESEIFLSPSDKSKLLAFDLCVGSRLTNSSVNTNAEECKVKDNSQRVGLMTLSDYINASVDPSCQTADNRTCQNYNYLVEKFNWWLATPVSNTTDRVFAVTAKGEIKSIETSEYYYVRPVIKLNSTVAISGGDGTKTDPYIIK